MGICMDLRATAWLASLSLDIHTSWLTQVISNALNLT